MSEHKLLLPGEYTLSPEFQLKPHEATISTTCNCIEKVIDAIRLSADFHLAQFGQDEAGATCENTGYRAAANMIHGFSSLLIKRLEELNK